MSSLRAYDEVNTHAGRWSAYALSPRAVTRSLHSRHLDTSSIPMRMRTARRGSACAAYAASGC